MRIATTFIVSCAAVVALITAAVVWTVYGVNTQNHKLVHGVVLAAANNVPAGQMAVEVDGQAGAYPLPEGQSVVQMGEQVDVWQWNGVPSGPPSNLGGKLVGSAASGFIAGDITVLLLVLARRETNARYRRSIDRRIVPISQT